VSNHITHWLCSSKYLTLGIALSKIRLNAEQAAFCDVIMVATGMSDTVSTLI
jgi:hypothetical protein